MEGSSSHSSLNLIIGLLYLLIFTNVVVVVAVDSLISPCNGSIAECYKEVETLMESEISRRFLGRHKDLTYDFLDKNKAPCANGRGKPYRGKCQPREANPYDRECSGTYNRCK